MNVAALLQDSPSDDRGRRQLREREQQQQQQQQIHHHQQPHHSQERSGDRDRPPQQQHPPPPQSWPRPARHSPQRHYPPPPSDYDSRVLPPPAALLPMDYEGNNRRADMHPHELSHRSHHGSPPQAHAPPHPPPYIVDHRAGPRGPASQALAHGHTPTLNHTHPHAHHHVQPHSIPNTPSPMYRPPPPRTGPPHPGPGIPPKLAPGPPPPPTGPGMAAPGHGSIPLYPTPVGPPPLHSSLPLRAHSPGNYAEPSPMYGLPPPVALHPSQQHRAYSAQGHSQGGSPAMGSLSRPGSFDERLGPGVGGPRGPPAAGSHPGSGMATGLGRAPLMLSAPGAGMHIAPMSEQERYARENRERMGEMERRERERERERERDRDRERERERERERWEGRSQEMNRMNAADMDMDMERDKEREWIRRQQSQGQTQLRDAQAGWPRFAHPRSSGGEEHREREREQREFGRDVERDRERLRDAEDARMRERAAAEWGPPAGQEKQEKLAARAPRKGSAKDKELREKEKAGKEAQDKERNRDVDDLDRQKQWMQGLELGWQQRDMMQREREMHREREEMDAPRARQDQQLSAHHYYHHPSAPSGYSGSPAQGHPQGPQPIKVSSATPRPAVQAGEGPPLYASSMSDRQQQLFQQGPSKAANGPGPSSLHPIPIQHQSMHPSHMIGGAPGHPHMHPHPHMGTPTPISFPPRRPSPPPHMPAGPLHMSPHAPPLLLPALPPLRLGTFVYPRTPFPFLAFPPDAAQRDVLATVLLPSGFLPEARPRRPRIWGGAPVPAVSPGREALGVRRVYTDDSDLFLCALHAGWVSWAGARRARKEGRDLRMELKMTREARYVGGFGEPCRKGKERADGEDGSVLLSAGWGNGHDGAGIEVLSAEFIAKGTAHSAGLRNRSQRLREYAERRAALGCSPTPSRKRQRPYSPVVEEPHGLDAILAATKTIVIANGTEGTAVYYKFHPSSLMTALFPQMSTGSRPHKRRRLSSEHVSDEMQTDHETSADKKPRAIIVETLSERFLFSPLMLGSCSGGVADKENISEGESDASRAGQRYMVALMAPPYKSQTLTSPPPAISPPEEQTCTDVPAKPLFDIPKPVVNGVAAKQVCEPPAVNIANGAIPASQVEPAHDVSAVSEGAASQSVGAKLVPYMGGESQSQSIIKPPEDKEVTTESQATVVSSQVATVKDPALALSTPVTPPQITNGIYPPETNKEKITPLHGSDSGPVAVQQQHAPGAIQILHEDLGEENFQFVGDGVHILSTEVVDGMRNGWKLFAQRWRWAHVDVSIDC